MKKKISIVMCCLLTIMIIQGTGILASEEIISDTKNEEIIKESETDTDISKDGKISEDIKQNKEESIDESNDVSIKEETSINKEETSTRNNAVVLSTMETEFPDVKFRAAVIEKFDKDGDGDLSQTEKEAVTNLSLNSKQIESLEGIKLFTNLVELYASKNKLKTLDVSEMKKLNFVQVNENQLVSLNASKNEKLQYLYANKNKLETLNVSESGNLQRIDANENQLVSIDTSDNTKLQYLYASTNKLTSVDVSSSPLLKELTLNTNLLTSINLENNINLESITIRDNNLTEINLENNAALKYLTLPNNDLENIDLSKNDKLVSVTLSNFTGSSSTTKNSFTKVDVSKNTLLKEYRVEQNEITDIDLSNNPAIEQVYLRNNLIKSADFSKNPKITQLYLSNNELTDIKLDGIVGVEPLFYIANNQLENIDVSSNTTLKTLDVGNNKLQNIDVKNNLDLKTLNMQKNQLTKVDVSKNTKLEYLYLDQNKVSSLDLSANPNMIRDYLGVQNVTNGKIHKKNNDYKFDFNQLVSQSELINVTVPGAISYDANSGIATFDVKPVDGIISYTYDTNVYDLKVNVKANFAYTVSFDASNETANDEIEVSEGETILNRTPQKTGFQFKGWFIDKEYTTPWDFTKGVDADLVLFAKWEETTQPKQETINKQDAIIEAGDTTTRYVYLSMMILAGLGIIITGKKLRTNK